MPTLRCAIYARVSTTDQHADNQIVELRQYCVRPAAGRSHVSTSTAA